MATFSLAALEPVLLPIVSPLVLQLWSVTLYPALQAEAAKVTNAEAKIALDAAVLMLNSVVTQEMAKLATGSL